MLSGVAASLIGVGLTGLTYPLYLRYLGYERYGLWLVLSVIYTFSQVGNLGISQAVSKEVAERFGAGDGRGVQERVTNALALLLISGALILMLVLAGRETIVRTLALSPENARIASAMIPFIALLSVYIFVVDATNATLAGFGRMDFCNYSQAAAQLTAAAMGIALLRSGFGIYSLLVATFASYICLHLISMYAIKRLFGATVVSIRFVDYKVARQLLGFGLHLTAGNILAMLLNPLNKMVLARYSGLSSVPIYDLSFTGCMRIRNLFDSSQRALIPEVSRHLAESKAKAHRHARALMRDSLRILLYAAVLFAGLIAAAGPLLHLWLGSKFDPASPFTVKIMLAGAFASLAGMPVYYALIGSGHSRTIVIANLIQFLVNLSMITASIVLYGRVPAGLVVSSTAIGMACSSIYLICSFASVTRESGAVALPSAPIPEVA